MRNDLRSFSVDAIERVEILDKKAKDVAEKRLDDVLGSGYGIFTGDNVTWAILRFTPERARWVASERWHPRQEATLSKDNSCVLKVPYTDDRELVMDILKYGGDCEVMAPTELRQRVAAELDRAQGKYRA